MRDLNRVTLIGNLTRDPEVRQTTTGQSVASFTIATNRSWVNPTGAKQDAVEYVDCVAWGKLGEIIGQILRKGGRVYAEGRLQTRSWEGQDGVKRYKTEVILSDFSSFDKVGAASSEYNADSNFANSPKEDLNKDQAWTAPTEPASEAPSKTEDNPEDQIDINNIPF